MKNLWTKKLTGHLTVQISGNGTERFINKLVREGLIIWNVKRLASGDVTFQMFISDVKELRKAVRYQRVKVRFIKRGGFPIFLNKMRRNVGLIAGGFIAILIVLILSNMIWNIDIEGATPEVEYKISNELQKLGVKKGQLLFLIDDPETIQQKITKKIEEITWIGVELKGTTFHFKVVEKERPEEPAPTSPRNLVAKKEAIIVDYFIEKGKPMISINDYVKPGQILVQGDIGKEGSPNFVPAKGVVYGKIWYETKSEVKLNSEVQVLSGEETVKKGIKLWGLSIPIWGFSNDNYENKEIEQSEKPLKFLKWTLPISFTTTTIREMEVQQKTYTRDEARELALKLAKQNLLEVIPNDAKIINENIRHETIENGKLKVIVIYEVIENIVKAIPIIPAS